MAEYYFSKVTGLHVAFLLKQDIITGVLLKAFQYFRTAIFMSHLWMDTSEFTDNCHSFYPPISCRTCMWKKG